MTADQVIHDTSWGPFQVNRTVTAAGAREQWVYPGCEFQYFVDGRLVAIETRGELTVSDNDSHDVWRALNEPPSIADPLVETADRITSMLRRIFAKLEERSLS